MRKQTGRQRCMVIVSVCAGMLLGLGLIAWGQFHTADRAQTAEDHSKRVERQANTLADQVAAACKAGGTAAQDLVRAGVCQKAAEVQQDPAITAKPLPSGPPGLPGVPGKPGRPGKDGARGEAGSSGTVILKPSPGPTPQPGKPGKDGSNGVDGKNGVDGAPGQNGRGVAAIAFDMDHCTATITYTDGTTEQTPMSGCNSSRKAPESTTTEGN